MPKSLAKPLPLIAATLALLASGFSLEGATAQGISLKRTEVFKTEGLVIRAPATYVNRNSLLLPRKK